MPDYYFHFTVSKMGSGSIVVEAELPLCAQDIRAAKRNIMEQLGLPLGTPPEIVDIDFIFELADRKGDEDVQSQG